ncbi:histidine phosphatase family protein [Azotobacter beijerinckii]|uniref:Broad specificity phosphatase PhoE n=1 Tax=Azotobacter beijerinckii TaxID=170623 RepID=A0A1I4GW89_9GAMM|nr:histidine phosphatase family protein [Azotobacter beijerinckii]SFB63442.1 Broad specificity phosphatase PhoE [Azotobacter beijerinckii]SFL34209.1 Broad specificity phosphatase PhoE [Azotobacter beijerinckii]
MKLCRKADDYQSPYRLLRKMMMRIVLLRHGKPHVPNYKSLKASQVGQWIEAYNAAGLTPDHKPPQIALEIAAACNAVMCSDLPRSIESAKALGVKRVNIIEPTLREVGLPFGSLPALKMPPQAWAVFFRIAWFCGYASNSESVWEAKVRASSGTARLKDLAATNGTVLFVGHGFLNKFLATELLSSGWKGPNNPGAKYWDFGTYEYAE